MLFDARVDVGEGADGAGNGASRHFLAGGNETLAAAGEFRIGLGQFQAECHRFGMDAVRAADGRRHLVLEGTLLDGGEQSVDIGDQQVGRPHELDVQAGVEHVGGGHALVDEARIGADEFGQMGEEGDDVVLRHPLDFVDPGDVEGDVAGPVPDRLCALLGDNAEVGEGVAGMGLDLKPDAEPGLRVPDFYHFGARIAGDHVERPALARGVTGTRKGQKRSPNTVQRPAKPRWTGRRGSKACREAKEPPPFRGKTPRKASPGADIGLINRHFRAGRPCSKPPSGFTPIAGFREDALRSFGR